MGREPDAGWPTVHERRIDGRVRRHASQEGRALQACLDCRACAAIRDSTRSQSRSSRPSGRTAAGTATGGRECHALVVPRDAGGRSSASRAYGADDAVARGAEFFLAARVVFSHRTGKPAQPKLLKLQLSRVLALRPAGGTADARSRRRARRLPRGGCARPAGVEAPPGRHLAHRGAGGGSAQGRKEADVEAVDWGDDGERGPDRAGGGRAPRCGAPVDGRAAHPDPRRGLLARPAPREDDARDHPLRPRSGRRDPRLGTGRGGARRDPDRRLGRGGARLRADGRGRRRRDHGRAVSAGLAAAPEGLARSTASTSRAGCTSSSPRIPSSSSSRASTAPRSATCASRRRA